jgi:hypothetical protein
MDYPDDRHKRRQYMDLGGVGGGTPQKSCNFFEIYASRGGSNTAQILAKKTGSNFYSSNLHLPGR